MTNLPDILTQLRLPFHPSHVTWKPQATSKDGAKAMATAYADVRAYQNRLDEVCGMDWSVTYTPWGDRIVCHLTIAGVTRSSTGEADTQSERSEIAGTAAESQAFKRAACMFGLGRYLYALPSVWVEYDAASKHFTDKAKAKLEGILVSHYRRAMGGQVDPQSEQSQTQAQADEASAELRKMFDEAGKELYGEQWAQVCRHNVERVTAGKATDPAVLTGEQIQKLLKGMNGLKSKRSAPATS